MSRLLPLGWLWDPNDMPSGDGKPSKADRLYWAAIHHEAVARQQHQPVCTHCGRPLDADEADYCSTCTIDISEDRED